MIVTGPSKPSSRRVRAAFPPAIPAPTITRRPAVTLSKSARFFVHQPRRGGHRFEASDGDRLARHLAQAVRPCIDAGEGLLHLLQLLRVELIGDDVVFAVVDPLCLVIVVADTFFVANRVHDVALPGGDASFDRTLLVDQLLPDMCDLFRLEHSDQSSQASQRTPPATNAGTACTTRMRRLTVAAPYAPAITMHTRKNVRTGRPAAIPNATSAQTSPPARKPLYRPWLAARVLVDSANSAVIRNVRRPTGAVHRNISSTRK